MCYNELTFLKFRRPSHSCTKSCTQSEEHEEVVIEEDIEDADWICCLDPVCGRWRHVTKNILDAYEHTFECSFLAPAVCEDSCDWCQVIGNPSCDSVGCLADGLAAAANICASSVVKTRLSANTSANSSANSPPFPISTISAL